MEMKKRDKLESWFFYELIDSRNLVEDFEERGEDTEYLKGYIAALEGARDAYERMKGGYPV